MKSSYHGGTLQNFVLQRQGIPEHEIMYIFYQLVQAITVSACNEPDLLIMRLTDALHNIHSIYIGEE
jgi:hypothetical protein